ncbi:hypothetical protein BC941DRAFT_415656 [Chlamydoabsidia padenii]|nr:hypothetical protein BC941DRAFT_415656 [Chlamydoabsidia padenii]
MKCISLFFFLFIVSVSSVSGQHTTSPRFSAVPQPTVSGVACIQKVCPSDSLQPTCPSDCPSGCKYIPDQCCPQVTVAVCQVGSTTSSSSSSSTLSPSVLTSPLPSSSSSSSSSLSTLSVSSPSSTPNSGAKVQASLCSVVSLILIGCLLL